MAVKPSLQALWLADDVLRDEETGKITLAGMFDQIEIAAPATHFEASVNLFFSITEIRDQTELIVAYVDLSDNSVLLERELSVASDDTLASTAVCLVLPKIPVPHSGVYALELHWQQESLGSSRITAHVR